MANNVTTASANASAVVARFNTREDAGTHTPVQILALENATSGATSVSATNAVPVTGTVTSNLGTLNGAATEATVSAIQADTAANRTLLGTIDADTGTLAAAVSGGLMQVKVHEVSGNVGVVWQDSVVDANNSTTSTLNANIDYTGTATDVLEYSGITITVFADQNSDANGLRFEFSSDGTNWDISQTFDYIASTGRQFQFATMAQYFRVAFQNGGTDQGAFRLQTVLHRNTLALTTIHRADSDIAVDRSATLTKSIIMAQAGGTGDFTPILATTGGNLNVSLQEASDGMDIGAGNAGTETLRVSIATDDVNLSSIAADASANAADTAAIRTDMATLAATVSGSLLEVKVHEVSGNVGVTGTVTANLGTLNGAATEATVSAIQADTAANRTLLGTIDGDTSVLAAIVSGGQLAVDIKDGAAGSTQYAEDAAHTTGDTGTMALAVEASADGTLVSNDGDYSPLQVDANGWLKVNIKSGAGSGGTSSVDDGGFTAGVGSGTPVMGFFSTDTVDANDVGVLAMDASRRLFTSLEVDNVGLATEATLSAVQADTAANRTLLGTIDADTGALAATVSGGRVEVKVHEVSGNVGVTGTVTANLGTLNGAATEATLESARADTSAIAAGVELLQTTVSGGLLQVKVHEVSGNVGVTGTVTANLGATDNAVLDEIEFHTSATQADTAVIRAAVSGSQMAVDVKDGGVAQRTDIMVDNVTQVTPKFARVSANAAGWTEQVARVAAKKIRVLQFSVVSDVSATIEVKSGTAASTNNLTGQMTFGPKTGISYPYSPVGLFETTASAQLAVSAVGASRLGGSLVYIEVD